MPISELCRPSNGVSTHGTFGTLDTLDERYVQFGPPVLGFRLPPELVSLGFDPSFFVGEIGSFLGDRYLMNMGFVLGPDNVIPLLDYAFGEIDEMWEAMSHIGNGGDMLNEVAKAAVNEALDVFTIIAFYVFNRMYDGSFERVDDAALKVFNGAVEGIMDVVGSVGGALPSVVPSFLRRMIKKLLEKIDSNYPSCCFSLVPDTRSAQAYRDAYSLLRSIRASNGGVVPRNDPYVRRCIGDFVGFYNKGSADEY